MKFNNIYISLQPEVQQQHWWCPTSLPLFSYSSTSDYGAYTERPGAAGPGLVLESGGHFSD